MVIFLRETTKRIENYEDLFLIYSEKAVNTVINNEKN